MSIFSFYLINEIYHIHICLHALLSTLENIRKSNDCETGDLNSSLNFVTN